MKSQNVRQGTVEPVIMDEPRESPAQLEEPHSVAKHSSNDCALPHFGASQAEQGIPGVYP